MSDKVWMCTEGCTSTIYDQKNRRCAECDATVKIQCTACLKWISISNKSKHTNRCKKIKEESAVIQVFHFYLYF